MHECVCVYKVATKFLFNIKTSCHTHAKKRNWLFYVYEMNCDDSGSIKIYSSDKAASDEARSRIEALTADIEVGKIYEGRVQKLMDFGAFVNILPGKDGLVHISQISEERVESVSDKLSEGDYVKVKVLEIDRQGRVRLSMKAVNE